MNAIHIAKAGMFSTVQDRGRSHLRHFGVVASGAMDLVSHELANVLVGNASDAATLEMTCTGDSLELPAGSLIAISGADMNPQLMIASNQSLAVPQNRPVLIRESCRLRLGNAISGFRTYLAVAGGIDVPIVMGSRSTYLRAGVGGYSGRTLKTGDLLPVGKPTQLSNNIKQRLLGLSDVARSLAAPRWFARVIDMPFGEHVELRVNEGEHIKWLDAESVKAFYKEPFQVSPSSDRMGYRMTGRKLAISFPHELLSEGITIGTLQLPADGDPILIMSDGAPTGGYPRIAHVAAVDLPFAAQIRPGQHIRFRPISIAEAHGLLRAQRKLLDQIQNTVQLWTHGTLP